MAKQSDLILESIKKQYLSLNFGWIIKSLLDMDYYKINMLMFIFFYNFSKIKVDFVFKNRTKKVKLGKWINEKELRKHLDHTRTLKFKEKEIRYLKSKNKKLSDKFLDKLRQYQLPEYKLEHNGEDIYIVFSGDLFDMTLWETLVLSIINELYYRAKLRMMTKAERLMFIEEGVRRLNVKIEKLQNNPLVKFIEFATRRRHSKLWQLYCLLRVIEDCRGNLIGTSNIFLAMELGIPVMGTFAHELFLVLQGIYHDDIRGSHNKVLELWEKLYYPDFMIALSDTYGLDFFLEDLTPHQIEVWKGPRDDSGDVKVNGDKVIDFYKKNNINPMTKSFFPSDGLDIDTMIDYEKYFRCRIDTSFGWGTMFANDMGLPEKYIYHMINDLGYLPEHLDMKPISIVCKVERSNGYEVGKLTNNIEKGCANKELRDKLVKIFDYEVTFKEECKV